MSKARFLPGHDAKLHSLVLRIHRKKAEKSELTTAEPTLEYLKTAAVEAARSHRKRTLSRAEIGRQLTEALDDIAELTDAARRGLGPTLKTKADGL